MSLIHQSNVDPHMTRLPRNSSCYSQKSSSCLYDTKSTGVQQHKPAVSNPSYQLYPTHNEHQVKSEANKPDSQSPKVLVEYDNFPPNKTIGPEMRIVIPPIPSSFTRSSPKDNQMQFPQMRASGEGLDHFSPIQNMELQNISDSDSDWEQEVMAGFSGFCDLWEIKLTNVCIYCKTVLIFMTVFVFLNCVWNKKKKKINFVALCLIKKEGNIYLQLRHFHVQLYKAEKQIPRENKLLGSGEVMGMQALGWGGAAAMPDVVMLTF